MTGDPGDTFRMGDPLEWVRSQVGRQQVRDGDRPRVVGVLQRLCRAAADALPATGVGLSAVSPVGGVLALTASDPQHEAVEELQFTVGEGPCLAAVESGGPVLTSDLAAATRTRWPGYGAAAQEHGVKAVFAFPLQVGAVRLGALDVYQDRPGPLSARATTAALHFAQVAVEALLDSAARTHDEPRAGSDAGAGTDDETDESRGVEGDERLAEVEDVLEPRVELYQAQGMVMIQLGVSLGEAMSRLRAFAYANDHRLMDLAADVVAGRVIFGEGTA